MTSIPEPYAIEGARQRFIDTNGVRLSVYEAGDPSDPTVVFSHGFPELGYSWRYQVPALAAAGFHVLVPDQRGYGGEHATAGAWRTTTSCTSPATSSACSTRLEIEQAVFVGHDWGGFVVWQMPFLQPDRVAGIVGVNTPHMPRMPIPPVELFRNAMGESFYIVWFQTPGRARGRARGATSRSCSTTCCGGASSRAGSRSGRPDRPPRSSRPW